MRTMKPLKLAVLIVLFTAALLTPALAERWGESAVNTAALIPVQDGGRVKPLSTYARFALLAMNGRRSTTTPDGRSLSATEWLLDTIYHPDEAKTYPVLLVQNSEVLDAIGIGHEGRKKRDRYSYEEIAPGRAKLMSLARDYGRIEQKERSTVQQQIIDLNYAFLHLEALLRFREFAQVSLSPVVNGVPALEKLFGGKDPVRFSDVVAKAQALVDLLGEAQKTGDDKTENAIRTLVMAARNAARTSRALAIFPPPGGSEDEKEWLTPADLLEVAFGGADLSEQARLLAVLEGASDGPPREFLDGVVPLAEARGEYGKIPLEVKYYRGGYLGWALGFFFIGFVLVAVSWLWSGNRWVPRIATVPIVIGLGALVVAIVLRCIIRDRPPVSTLYETILFITAVAVLAGLVTELIIRRRVALAVSAVIGLGGMFLASRYEVLKGVDTMPTLVAVLDTNFWLSTHVTTISMGYAAGLLAAAIAHVYIIAKLFGAKKNDPQFYRNLTRMVYGVTAFGLFFSVLGTLLGGIWANESWGRFWGWDPKENGALMICLWMLITLHAYYAKYIRDLGLSLAAIFGGVVVAFSWWGVNLLGVGLHSYGFTSGILMSLLAFGATQAVMLGLGMVVWLRDLSSGTGPSQRVST